MPRFNRNLPVIVLILMTALMTLSDSTLFAKLASDQEMETVCQNWLTHMVSQKGTWAGETIPQISDVMEIRADNGTLLARCFNITPNGFVVVPVLKEMTPVKAYSDRNMLDERQEGGFLLLLKEMFTERMELYRQRFGSLEAEQDNSADPVFGRSQRALWDAYTVSPKIFQENLSRDKNAPLEEAGPLLTSSWHQRVPYQNNCPQGDGGQCVVGCVATAAAQIMNFWEWPPSGYDDHGYTWNGDQSCEGNTEGEYLYADFTDSYDWDNMPDSCDDGCSQEDSAALAHFNYEVGVAFEMDYGACGSGAYVSMATIVFPGYYKYSRDITRRDRIDYTLEGWYNAVKDEIDAGRPIQYRINSHSIVADGYRNDGGQYEYHMNYGWGGSYTTWFVLDSLYCSWVEGSVCPASEEFMITNIKPQTTPILEYTGMTLSEETGDGDGHGEAGETVNISVNIQNAGWNAYNIQGILTCDDPYITVTSGTVSFGTSLPWGGEKTSNSEFQLEISSSCPDPRIAVLDLELTSSGGYSFTDSFFVFMGDTPGFDDDIESGEGFWTNTSFKMGFGNQWHLEDYRAFSGGYSWKCGGTGNQQYANSVDGALITPPFLLPENAALIFRHWIDMELDSEPGMAWDGATVMISTGDGSWTFIEPLGGYPYEVVDNSASPYDPNTPCYSGTYDWDLAEFNLSSYSGVVQLMFRFGSDGYTTGEGWYIDDISVTQAPYICGDANRDDIVNVSDAVHIINYVFVGGAAPDPLCIGDANGDGFVNISDAIKLINYVFIGGDPPEGNCCD